MTRYPRDLSGVCVPWLLMREHPEISKSGVIYMDLWPVSQQMLSVIHPDLMAQFCQDPSMLKADLLHSEFMPFTQCNDLVNLEGQEWKTWRSIFNPGFSARNILTLVPAMLEEIHVFRAWLETCASTGETVALEKQTMRLTVDVIGRAVL